MKENTLPSPERREDLTHFFFWTAWATATERPGTDATYTNNWPPQPLISNHPTAENIMWSLACVIHLIAGRSEEHTSEPQSLMRTSYAVFCLKKNTNYSHTACTH